MHILKSIYFYLFFFFFFISGSILVQNKYLLLNIGSIFPRHVNINSNWSGNKTVKENISILVLAGHADSQGIAGRGTEGEAVAILGKLPMDPEMSDELYWNLKLQNALVNLGRKQGLTISSYVPPISNLLDPNNPISNWSVGAKHALKGGYVIEIHFDAYGKYGVGSGLIPAISSNLNTVDEALAKEFGRFPLFFRGGLGAPRRQIRVLEIGKLEGTLEQNLRDLATQERTLQLLANRIIQAIIEGCKK